MKKLRQFISLLVVLCLVFSMATTAFAGNFTKTEEWSDQLFTDVNGDNWYYAAVQNAYEMGLMAGHGDGTFDPDGEITLAQTVTIAARIHSIHHTGEEHFEQGTPWYQVYVDYALANGILDAEVEDWNKPATRLEFAHILAKALPAEELTAINTVDDGAIPDVEADEAVYALYRAGVLVGSDAAGTFNPKTAIKRSEVATIAARMADSTLREKITLTKEEYVPIVTPVQPEISDIETDGGEDEQLPEDVTPDQTPEEAPEEETEDLLDENNALTKPFDQTYPDEFASGEYQYSGEHILIKLSYAPSEAQMASLTAAGITELEHVMNTSNAVWYKAIVSTTVEEAMDAVRALSFVLVAEYDYVYETDTIIECGPEELDDVIKGNNYYDQQWYLRSCGLRESWDHLKKPHKRPHYDEEAGESGIPEDAEEEAGVEGGEGIVVAVIDTGVDYTHEDLKDNIWINTAEIPDNGKDDDGNGYIDDYYGYNAVAGKGSGMDDNGHGTHVAGIIAASNNNLGIVGIAYNAQIMTIKAGMASGYFNQSDIAEAIIYACANGADVINMSFGGSASTILVQDALEDAYTHCVLVAAAGNNGKPNEDTDYFDALPTYPAALTYVLGVMSVDSNGVESSFSNWDATAYNSVEYELYAPGDQMISTIPGDRYATWSGTSMAAPVVSAMAALLRSEFRDRNTYPTKFIYGQLCATSDVTATCCDPQMHKVNGGTHNLPQIVDLYSALTELPNPEVSVSDYALFDTAGLLDNEKNNGDGVIDAGETFAIGFALSNRWGKSENTIITVDTLNQVGIADPYITIHTESINIGSVGTYSTYDGGRVIEDDQFVGWENPIYITVSPDCPNDYIFTLNVTVTCENGLDSEDTTVYSSSAKVDLTVRRGVILPSIIEEDMTLTADNYYIIPNATLIAEGAAVTVEAGTNIQFWSDDANDPYADQYIAYLNVEGKFIVNGTAENPVNMFPGERMLSYRVEISEKSSGRVELYYTNVTNPYLTVSYAEGCRFSQSYLASYIYYRYLSSGVVKTDRGGGWIGGSEFVDCFYYKLGGSNYQDYRYSIQGRHVGCVFVDSAIEFGDSYGIVNRNVFEDCLFYGNNNYLNNTSGYVSGMTLASGTSFAGNFYTDEDSGRTYFVAPSAGRAYQLMAESLGGSLVCFNSPEELEFVKGIISNQYYNYRHAIGLEYDKETGEVYWADGTEVGSFLEYAVETKAWNQSWISGYYKDQSITAAPDTAANYAIYEFPAPYVETITLDSYTVTMDTESSGCQIYAQAGPTGVADALLVYESLDESVAKVSNTGYITPVGVGEAEIRVYSPDLAVYNSLTVTVLERVALESISLGEDFCIDLGGQVQLNPVLTPANTTQNALVYSSSNEVAVTVSGTGVVTAVGSGVAVITATNPDSGLFATVTVEGVIPVTSVTVEESIFATDLDSEETVAILGITVAPADASYPELTWESSNPKILEVDADGKLIKHQLGTATLRATNEGSGLYAEVTVAITEVETEVTVVEMHRVVYSDYVYVVALLSDGTMWYWGTKTPVPQKLPVDNVQMFDVGYSNMGSKVNFMVVDNAGVLNVYTSALSSFADWTLTNSKINGKSVSDVIAVTTSSNSNNNFVYVKSDGTVWGWGQNVSGQLGTGGTSAVYSAQQIPVDANIVDVAMISDTLAMLDENGDVWYCGSGTQQTYTPTKSGCTGAIALRRIDGWGILVEYADSVQHNLSGTKEENPGVKMIYNESSYWYIGEDGYVYVKGSNSYGQLGTGSTDSVDSYVKMEEVSNVADIFLLKYTVYIQTNDGAFYGVGRNDAYQIPNLTTGSQTVPTRIFFGLSGETEAPALEGTNLEEEALNEAKLILDFDQAIVSGISYASIKLQNSAGDLVGVRRAFFLDKFEIAPAAGFTAGESYTLTIPANAFTNKFGVANAKLVLTFTAGEGAVADGSSDSTSDSSSDTSSDTTTEVEEVVNETRANPDFTGERDYLTLEDLQAKYEELNVNSQFVGNAVINRLELLNDVTKWLRIQGSTSSSYSSAALGYNYWGTTNETLIGYQILDFDDFQTLKDLDPTGYLTEAPENVWPFAVNAGLINKDGEVVDVIGNELVTFFVEFNRDMETSVPLDVRFGSCYPYGDYQVEGEWVSARRWEGTTTLTTLIEGGYQYFSIENGHAAGKPHLTLFDDWGRFMFTIDTSEALALTLQGEAGDEGVTLTWTQDDFDTLMGYNVYRAEQDEDAYYQKLNTTIIPNGTETYFDDTVEPGKVYYYIFTVVKTDFTESEPSGKIRILSKDTMSPILYHTPVYTAYEGNNVVISATASDNLQLASVTLYYRAVGAEDWNEVTMSKLNDKYSAVISGDKVTLAGIEYYVSASDGINTVYRGTAEEPYAIVVKEDPGDVMMGDVNGDGRITLADALMHLQAVNDRIVLDEEQFARADLDGDGVLETYESLMILQYVNGIIGSLTVTG